MANVLLVDDEAGFATATAEFLRAHEHSVTVTDSLGAARKALELRTPHLLILDLILPDGSGLELLEDLGEKPPRKTVIITGHPGIRSIIRDVAGPNVSYLTKPVEPRDLLGLANAVDAGDEEDEAPADDSDLHFGVMVGESESMQRVYRKIEQVARTDSTVFIQGESGTGKELVAESIHRASRRSGRFVPVNCGGLSKDLVASELFGHEKGSFTGASRRHAGFFERADNGTLFLDEITEMPAGMQTHLLRVLETGQVLRVGGEKEIAVSARLLAATNRDPAQAVAEDRLREDLYFRLRVFPIELPPLRHRKGDVSILANHFLAALNERYDSRRAYAPEALEAFEQHSWPGNVRELKHTVHRAYLLSEGDAITAPDRFDEPLMTESESLTPQVGRSIADVEKDLITSTLEHYDGDKKAAAATLGISLKTLYNRLNAYRDEA